MRFWHKCIALAALAAANLLVAGRIAPAAAQGSCTAFECPQYRCIEAGSASYCQYDPVAVCIPCQCNPNCLEP